MEHQNFFLITLLSICFFNIYQQSQTMLSLQMKHEQFVSTVQQKELVLYEKIHEHERSFDKIAHDFEAHKKEYDIFKNKTQEFYLNGTLDRLEYVETGLMELYGNFLALSNVTANDMENIINSDIETQ